MSDELTVLFIGDSVTDVGRRDDPEALGHGYVRLIDEAFRAGGTPATVVNRGTSGNRVRDLKARWQKDCLDLAPSLVSVMIGVNDTWRRYDDNDPTTPEQFAADYRAILSALPGREETALVLMEPFLLPVTPAKLTWRDDLEEKIAVVRELAVEFGAVLVETDDYLNGFDVPLVDIAADGIHPTELGHQLLAKLWLETIENAAE
ncbi:lysophospholipase L1-like esterase [Conyzicola lurida]|uniref:Lysophospholipase L1-like esterase n=1 Tax=Conyzicola lurida TaxID=1172621 RepID=A0A841AK99_9MICO|nr:SGNH/GDSL hydrolase family protein [Conyzicola lurida]MBB5841895.1 lysophospholipase L1-like esterase [Conyzicola lurida]